MSYLDYSGRDDKLSGGARRIPVDTPSGQFSVWTKRIGNNPDLKVLILHGGPGATHEYLEACDSFLPGAGVEYYHYDQLGSGFSDRPDIPSLWTLERFVSEVEQVRLALGLGRRKALVAALEQWPADGIPASPGAWLMLTAKHRAIDRIRRNERLAAKLNLLGRELETAQQGPPAEFDAVLDEETIDDDLLRLMFVACHPVLPVEGRIALTLRLIGGLTTQEIARGCRR